MFAQSCSKESITAKYWQYRNNLTHFVAVDRDPSGCIHDGIGQSATDPCVCSKAGYGLPATAINITSTGRFGMGDRVDSELWYDEDCADDDSGLDDGFGHTKNWLDMGSETPHQMGWYWVTLATEWKLLKENGQEQEARRTLEELVLGLQAYRRLDITANCLAAARYQEITDGFETGPQCEGDPCLCAGPYQGNESWNFDVGCLAGCDGFTPQTDGYSGFFLREDATQALEGLLHDPSEGKWNIDVVGGNGYAMSLSPPCATTFSQTCYLVHRQSFMSQDGVFALMLGLAMIKRFIPDYAKVTTCEGVEFSPLQMAKDIAGGITDRIDNAHNNRVLWPGSDKCCNEDVYFTEREGGRLIFTIHGLKRACNYVDDANRHSGAWEYFNWSLLKTQASGTGSDNEVFWLRLKTLGWDMGGDSKRDLYESSVITQGMEILPLMNNLLYPDIDGSDIGIDKQKFQDMLCAAPCGGPCKKKANYPETNEFPEFDCANNPGWPGQRWEGGSPASNDNRQFNGLDFMALYNLYLLYFPEERTAYFHPDRPGAAVSFGSGNIAGPNTLCEDDEGHYELLYPQPNAVQNLVWTTSANLAIIDQFGLEADVLADAPIATPGFIQAAFTERRDIRQYFDAIPQGSGTVADLCELAYRKPIYSLIPGHNVTTELDHCHGAYEFHAVATSPDIPGSTYTWVVEAVSNSGGTVIMPTFTGKDTVINQWHWLPGTGGYLNIRLTVATACGTYTFQFWGIDYGCGLGRQVIVAPNPTNNGNQVVVNVTNDYLVSTDGLDVRFIRTSTGNVQSTQRIYQNGQFVSTAGFPTGNYTVRVALEDNTVLTTTLVVSDN